MSDPRLSRPSSGQPAARAAILRFGARTALGLSAPASCAAARAELTRFVRCRLAEIAGVHEFTISPLAGQGGAEPALAATPAERLAAPAAAAAAEALGGLCPAGPALPGRRAAPHAPLPHGARLEVLLGLPAPRPGWTEASAAAVGGAVARVAEDLGLAPRVRAFASGHAAGFRALGRALEIVGADAEAVCLVGGADSYLAIETLAHLHRTEQLKSDRNRWGFVAGEAVCFATVVSAASAPARGADPAAWVLSAASADEPLAPRGEEPILGKALTAAIRSALAPMPAGALVDEVWCDLNGERWRGEEIGLVVPRLAGRLAAPDRLSIPAAALGDVGAASGPLSWALAAHMARRGLSRGPWALTFASEDGPARGAALLWIPPADRA
ncbi:MAG: hypothetical protein IT372_40625 [Polyangiaceae bacterium]|nr:hypothetical protein [Polyangiaceae bacterium]